MKNKVSRIIIDTNLWISFLITKNFTKLDEIIFSKKCELSSLKPTGGIDNNDLRLKEVGDYEVQTFF